MGFSVQYFGARKATWKCSVFQDPEIIEAQIEARGNSLFTGTHASVFNCHVLNLLAGVYKEYKD